MLKNLFLWLFIAVVLISTFNNFDNPTHKRESFSYSEFVNRVKEGDIQSLTIHRDRSITGQLHNENGFISYMPIHDPHLLSELIAKGVTVKGEPPHRESVWIRLLVSSFPMLILVGIWGFFMRQMGGGRGGLSFGKSPAHLLGDEQVKVRFSDVAGIEEAKAEVVELVDFLKDPHKFQNIGGKIPRGVLLVGKPGTGKTLLARAVAGEANVPFFTVSGSDFMEMFVGVGASRIRDMFEQAKKQAPCIIFIDEIDAVGRRRATGFGGGHDEREQTLNQLLVKMDGFTGNEGVIIIAATNRPDILDPALLRPGRFDRQVMVELPDLQGRQKILQVHLKKVRAAETVDTLTIARGIPGFSGADIANLVNEAALSTASANKPLVDMQALQQAKDKIMIGPERRTMVINEKEKKLTAYHEAGHAIIGRLVPEHDPIYKVTIIPRGRALGMTMFLPEEDRYSYTKQRLESQIASLFGGRIAEELIFGPAAITTGASNDIERATEIARNMITKWGLSAELGPLNYTAHQEESMHFHSQSKEYSEETASLIDKTVRKVISRNYELAKKLLQDNIDILHQMAKALIQYETIEASQIDALMQRESIAAVQLDTTATAEPNQSAVTQSNPVSSKSTNKTEVIT